MAVRARFVFNPLSLSQGQTTLSADVDVIELDGANNVNRVLETVTLSNSFPGCDNEILATLYRDMLAEITSMVVAWSQYVQNVESNEQILVGWTITRLTQLGNWRFSRTVPTPETFEVTFGPQDLDQNGNPSLSLIIQTIVNNQP